MDNSWCQRQTWNSEAASHFESKLKRARLKGEYLGLQARALAKNHPVVALELVERFFRASERVEHRFGLVTQALAFETLGKIAEAAMAYRAALAQEAEMPGSLTNADIDFPYLVAKYDLRDQFAFASTILAKRKASSPLLFPEERFKWHATAALLLNEIGNSKLARQAAGIAIDEASTESSGLPSHPQLGLVGNQHLDTLKRLAAIAGA